MVYLRSNTGNLRSLDIEHAQRLLQMPNSLWVLEDKNFIFENNELRRKPNNKSNIKEAKAIVEGEENRE